MTGLTLSSEQLVHAKSVIGADALGKQVDLRLQDYREVGGSFDRIVSIEMLEAVGEQYWPTYFETLRARLKLGGKAVLQVITISEDRFATYRKGADFIQRYIFPGGMLPTKAILAAQAARAGLKMASVETFGDSYAMTLAEIGVAASWRHGRTFEKAWIQPVLLPPLGILPLLLRGRVPDGRHRCRPLFPGGMSDD